jgi:hypothetical protein
MGTSDANSVEELTELLLQQNEQPFYIDCENRSKFSHNATPTSIRLP